MERPEGKRGKGGGGAEGSDELGKTEAGSPNGWKRCRGGARSPDNRSEKSGGGAGGERAGHVFRRNKKKGGPSSKKRVGRRPGKHQDPQPGPRRTDEEGRVVEAGAGGPKK